MGRIIDLNCKATRRDWAHLWLKALVVILIPWLAVFIFLTLRYPAVG